MSSCVRRRGDHPTCDLGGPWSMKYADLTLDSVVLHEVLRRGGADVQPVLSDAPTPLTEADKAYIQLRVRKAIARAARPVVEEQGASKLPDLVRDYFSQQDPDIVSISQEMAALLQATQHHVSPGGIFLFGRSHLDGKPALILAKLEHEQGVRATQTRLGDGSNVFAVEFLRDLLFTSSSKVFKVAVFTLDGVGDESVEGIVVDRQAAGSSVAVYFLSEFLGCRFAERSDVITQRFHDLAQAWINNFPESEKRGRYEVALLSELQSNRTMLSTDAFASQYLDLDDRDGFTRDIQGGGVPPREFAKNVALVAAKIKRLRLETEAGVMVLAPPSTISDGLVAIEDNDDDTSTVTVRDRVTRLDGQGRLKSGQGAAQ